MVLAVLPVPHAPPAESSAVKAADTRNGDPEAQAEDVYMTKLVHGSSADATGAGASPLFWAVIGAAAALVLAGIALVAASGRPRVPVSHGKPRNVVPPDDGPSSWTALMR